MRDIDEIRNTLVEHITVAFANVERGNGTSLHEADVIDGGGYGKKYIRDRAKARRIDSDRRWQDVPDGDIEDHPSILSFLDAEGLRYYTPAYMVWALKHYRTSASMSSDSIIYQFDVMANRDLHTWQMSRFENLTPEQRTVVCRFLRFMADYGDGFADEDAALRALEGHWGQFCNR